METPYTSISSRKKDSLYNEFCKIDESIKPKIKEIITLSTKNLLDMTDCLVKVYEKLNDSDLANFDVFSCIKQRVMIWNDEMMLTHLSQRRSLSRMISDLKYIIGSVESADQLFLEIDNCTTKIKQEWSTNLIGKTSESLRDNFLDIIMIMDPEIKATYDDRSKDIQVIEERIKEVERKSLSFLDSNRLFMMEGYKKFFDKKNSISNSEVGQCSESKRKDTDKEINPVILSNEDGSIPFHFETDRSETENKICSNLSVIKNKRITPINMNKVGKGNVVIVNEDFSKNITTFKADSGIKNKEDEDKFNFSISEDDEINDLQLNKGVKLEGYPLTPVPSREIEMINPNEVKIKVVPLSQIIDSSNRPNLLRKRTDSSKIISPEKYERKERNYESLHVTTQEETYMKTIQKDYHSRNNKKYDSLSIHKLEFNNREMAEKMKEHFLEDKENIKLRVSLPNDTLTMLRTNGSIKNNSKLDSMRDSLSFSNYTFNILETKNSGDFFSQKSLSKRRFKKDRLRMVNEDDESLSKIELMSMSNGSRKNTSNRITLNLNSKASEESILTVEDSKQLKYDDDEEREEKYCLNSTSSKKNDSSGRNNVGKRIEKIKDKPLKMRNENYMFTTSRNNSLNIENNTHQLVPKDLNLTKEEEENNENKESNHKLYSLGEWDNFRKVYSSSQNSNPTTPIRGTIDFQEEKVSLKTPINDGNKGIVDLKKKTFKGFKNFDEFLKDRNSEKLHVKILNIEKVTISNDGNYLLFGGKGLHVLDMTKEKFRLIRYDKSQSNL